ncbi:MAG: flagellar basal-body MS-ring/collar protein FliF [Acidobacteriota bacterium]
MDPLREQIRALLAKLTLGQKVLIGGSALAAIVAIITLVSLMNRPTYVTLFSNLNATDASKIVERLKEKKVAYKLDDAGRTVLVPKEQLYDLRLSMAGEGLLQSSTVGYEIFDKTNLGASDFVQKLNYRRALEGELARTILTIDEVEGARVHIVIPEKALFKEDQKDPTASVVLKLRSGKLSPENIEGIARLVSSSVEGLNAKNVSIMDSHGNVLSTNTASNTLAALSSTQYELQHKVETYLAQQAQSMLDGVVGPSNSIVRVTAELNFNQVEQTVEKFDPDGQVVRSEQSTEEKTAQTDSLPPGQRTNAITNYEISKTLEHIVAGTGNVNRLSVAVLINGKPVTKEVNGKKETQIIPRSSEEITQLTDIVKKAVGFDQRRADEISFVNLPFDNRFTDEQFVQKEDAAPNDTHMQRYVIIGAMLGAVVILFMLIGRLKARRMVAPVGQYLDIKETVMQDAQKALESAQAQQIEKKPVPPLPEKEVPVETIHREERRQRVMEYIREKPQDTSKVVKLWLTEENG